MKNLPLPLAAVLLASAPISGVLAANTELNDVIVTANNTPQSLSSVTANAVIIDRQTIEQNQYATLTDALKHVAGIYVKSSGGMGKTSSIFLRGASSSDRHVLILVDGIEQTDPSGFGADIANLQLDNVERIEILKGAQSGVWGANASAGVINIITRQSGTQASGFVEAGADNSLKLGTTLGAQNQHADFVFHFATQSTDGFSAIKPYGESEYDYEADGFEQTDLSFKLGVNLSPSHRVETLIKTTSSSNDYDGVAYLPPTYAAVPQPDDADSQNDFDSTTRQLQYRFNHDNLNARLFISDHHIERSFSSGYEYEGLIETYGGQAGMSYGEADEVQISATQQLFKDELNGREYRNTGYALTNTNHLGQKLVLTESLRHDEYDEFKNATTGKLGAKYRFTPEIFVSANAGTGYNAPSLYQLSTPNPSDLKPESVESYDLTLGAYGLEITYFNNQTEDLIEYVYTGDYSTSYYDNSDQLTKTEGWEASYRHSFDAISTDLTLNATWLETRNSSDQLKAYIPQHQANLLVDFYGWNQIQLGLETRYTGSTYSADDKQGAQLGDYFVTDLKVNYDVNPNLEVYAKLLNALDEDYATSVADYPATQTTPDYVYSSGGRALFVGLRGHL